MRVAEAFGKDHKNVIQAIELLDCSEDFRELNFQLSSYKVPGNRRSYPMYTMTRDGFSFLAMGFNGSKAAYWKEQFIAAFNAMEKRLTVLDPDFSEMLNTSIQNAMVPVMKQVTELVGENRDMKPKADN